MSNSLLRDVAAERTELTEPELEYLELLLADWNLLADLAFADQLLWVPTWNESGFVAAAQIRPNTARSHIPDDLVGHFAPKGKHFELDRALATGAVVYGAPTQAHAVTMAIPVRHAGRTIAILGRYAEHSEPGRLASAYAHLSDILTAMVASGDFPRASGDDQGTGGRGGAPRVGDGLLTLDTEGVIVYASPNANSAFKRLGLSVEPQGNLLADLVARLNRTGAPVDDTLSLVARGRIQGTAEIDAGRAAATMRSIPLVVDGVAKGTMVLMRDVTDLRRREKALLGKDAAIREIHHRVKNNLQTVASLLRLQGRRLTDPAAQVAIAEAVRRVGTIAVVHDLLAHEPGQVVDFDHVAKRVVALTIETAPPARVQHSVQGAFGELPTDAATPLALVIAELVANAVEHGSVDRGEVLVTIRANREDGNRLVLAVNDDGPGLPPSVDLGLGLSIVQTLVRDELHGKIDLGPGAQVRVEIPL